jgi:outer membrane protein, heavy metal efflux system
MENRAWDTEAFIVVLCSLLFALVFTAPDRSVASEGDLKLRELIDEALQKSPEILASRYRADASQYRIPQVKSLPDPMVMFGYQNEGWGRYTYGEMQMSWWMFSASQMVPFPGKLSLKGEMASKESESLRAAFDSSRLKVIMKVKELYYDLFLGYKNIDLLRDRVALFSRIEDAATARYSSGMGPQQDVLMAQTEKYMLLEKEEMQKQKIQSLEAMLNSTIGREVNSPLGRPTDASATVFVRSVDEMLRMAYEHSPEVRAREKMVGSSETKVRMAEKEYYPDFTFTGNVMKRKGEFDDMWSLTAAMNIPLYYRTKQRQAVSEAKASLSEARNELEATKLMIASNIRDSYAMVTSAQRLMKLYQEGLIPKTTQDFESALAGYGAGKVDALTVISRLRALLEFETLYWTQFVEKEKAAARLESMAGIMESGGQ